MLRREESLALVAYHTRLRGDGEGTRDGCRDVQLYLEGTSCKSSRGKVLVTPSPFCAFRILLSCWTWPRRISLSCLQRRVGRNGWRDCHNRRKRFLNSVLNRNSFSRRSLVCLGVFRENHYIVDTRWRRLVDGVRRKGVAKLWNSSLRMCCSFGR